MAAKSKNKKKSSKSTKKSSTPAKAKTAKKPAPPVRKKIRIDPAFQPLLKSLQERRNEITGQVSHLEQDLKDDMADNQNVPGDMADYGSGELNQHLSVTLMENDRIELERIERAISRIEQGVYGQCEVCEKSIPMARLKAIPWAIRCIQCQSRFEGA